MDNEKRRPILRYTLDAVPQVLRETTGGQSTRNLYGLDLFAQQQGATTTYLGYDALSVRLHLDEAGDIAAAYRYGPYGEVGDDGPEGYGYTGEAQHSELGLLYLRARYYQPETGRFISRDLWSGHQVWPISLQRFVYAANNPANAMDPSGLQTIRYDILPGIGMIDGGLGYGQLFEQSDWWDIFVPRTFARVARTVFLVDTPLAYAPSGWGSAGLESFVVAGMREACAYYNADVSSSGWQTVATYEDTITLPISGGQPGWLLRHWGAAGAALNDPLDCYGPPAKREVYQRMRIDASGYAYVTDSDAGHDSHSYALPASVYTAPATSYATNRHVFWDPLPNAAEEIVAWNVKGKMLRYGSGSLVNVGAVRAGFARGMGALSWAADIVSQGDFLDRRYRLLLQRRGLEGEKRAIIQTYYAFNGSEGLQIRPAFLGMQSGTWKEWSMRYSPAWGIPDHGTSHTCGQAKWQPCLGIDALDRGY